MNVDNTQQHEHRYTLLIAKDRQQIRAAQALRYQVFSEELGANLKTPIPNYDIDYYDDFCHHILVCDAANNEVIGCTRILTSDQVAAAGGYYSESEFDLTNIYQIKGKLIEVGRTCVHAAHRRGSVMSLLWAGLSRFMVEQNCDYFMGCASIPLTDDAWLPLFDKLQQNYGSDENMRVFPKLPLNKSIVHENSKVEIPALLKAYIRLGAKICGEPCWDAQFKVADVFIIVSLENLQQRYFKHFVDRAKTTQVTNNVIFT
jgi:putative hemolysin